MLNRLHSKITLIERLHTQKKIKFVDETGTTKIKELSERAHIPHAPHIDRNNAKFLK
jgi:hypothetical protein